MNVYLTDDLKKALANRAAKENRSHSQVVQMALRAYLVNDPPRGRPREVPEPEVRAPQQPPKKRPPVPKIPGVVPASRLYRGVLERDDE